VSVEILWRLKKSERRTREDAEWRHHSVVTDSEAEATIQRWNLYAPFFEYQIGPGKGPPKAPSPPMQFDFRKDRKKPVHNR